MIRVTGQNGGGAVELLEQHDAHQLMRPSGLAEREFQVGALAQAVGKPIGGTDHKSDRGTVFGAPFAQQRGERRAVEIIAALIEQDEFGVLRNNVGDGDGFLDTAAFNVLRPAFSNFDDFDVAQSERSADAFCALAIRLGELPLGSLLNSADRNDKDAHGGFRI